MDKNIVEMNLEDIHEMLRPIVFRLAETHTEGDVIVLRFEYGNVRIEF